MNDVCEINYVKEHRHAVTLSRETNRERYGRNRQTLRREDRLPFKKRASGVWNVPNLRIGFAVAA